MVVNVLEISLRVQERGCRRTLGRSTTIFVVYLRKKEENFLKRNFFLSVRSVNFKEKGKGSGHLPSMCLILQNSGDLG